MSHCGNERKVGDAQKGIRGSLNPYEAGVRPERRRCMSR
jgi:hypothetical protein